MENSDSNVRSDLEGLCDFLTAISARILQVTDRKAGAAMGAATNATIGSAFATTVMGAVGSLGTAGTGAAIAGLSGAAKTSATLAWIGGIAGGGVAAGTALLGAGALGVGIYGSIRVRRAILGYSRREEALSQHEQQILEAAGVLTIAIRKALEGDQIIDGREVAALSRIGITPFVENVEAAIETGKFADLNTYNRVRLRGHLNNLRAYQRRLIAHDPSP